MTIIVTQINKFGIVLGSDSNISNDRTVIKEDKKIFEIRKLKSALCTAGSYSVNGTILSEWLLNFISGNESKYSTLKEFTELLSKTLEDEMNPEEKKALSITHIAGYQGNHPEMWCISNTRLQDNGQYGEGENNFHYSEDLWNNAREKNKLETGFNISNGLNYQLYINGFISGRVAFHVARKFIDNYFSLMWQASDYKFRPPQNIEEHKIIVELYIDLIDRIFQLSNYEPKIIGGKTQTFVINNPTLP
ncbi:MAG: hypothetical protein AAB019_00060 [Planctomycetota bacterium]